MYKKASSQKRKVISADKYDKLMSDVIRKKLSIDQTLIEMLEVASRYDIKGMNKSAKIRQNRSLPT